MAKRTISFIISLSFILTTLTIASPNHGATFSEPISRQNLGLNNKRQTHLTFYFHDTLTGPNPTAIQIAKPLTSTSTMSFGSLTMIDDPLTEGPELDSKKVGRAQGMYTFADQTRPALIMIMNFEFVDGNYKGSTLSILGRNPVDQGVREMPVVGGTGTFRFAAGYAVARTYTSDPNTGDAVVKYDVYVSHADSSSTLSNRAPHCRRVSIYGYAMFVSLFLAIFGI